MFELWDSCFVVAVTLPPCIWVVLAFEFVFELIVLHLPWCCQVCILIVVVLELRCARHCVEPYAWDVAVWTYVFVSMYTCWWWPTLLLPESMLHLSWIQPRLGFDLVSTRPYIFNKTSVFWCAWPCGMYSDALCMSQVVLIYLFLGHVWKMNLNSKYDDEQPK